MMVGGRFVLMVCFLLCGAGHVRAMNFDLNALKVEITSSFYGQKLTVFGIKKARQDIAVVIEGPGQDMMVRQKARIAGAWVNRNFVTFKEMPIFYDYAVSSEEVEGYSPESLDFLSEKGGDHLAAFKAALLRNKRAEGLYPHQPGAVKVLSESGLFRVDFYIPSNVPVGEYYVHVHSVDGGKVTTQSKVIRVGQMGFNASTQNYAKNYAFIYGVLCIGLAVFAGWFSNRVRRRV